MLMKCFHCKREIPDDAVFCCYCGSKLVREKKRKSRANGTGTVFQLPNKKWKAQVVLYYYVGKDGKRKKKTQSQTFDKKSDALKAVGKEPDEDSELPTLNDLYEIFKSTRQYDKLSSSQKDKLCYAWNRMKEVQFTKIADLTLDQMQEVVNRHTDTYYPARDMKVLLSHLYEMAMRRKKETINMSKYIELPDPPKAKRQVFGETDIAKFWDDYNGQTPEGPVKPHEFTGYILIMNYTGMRIGELYKIEKVNVHLKDHYMVGGEKTQAGIDREIPISSLIEPIVKHFYDKGKTKLVHKNIWGFYDEYWDTLKRLGIRKLPPQTCRHTYFTRLAENKVHPALIAAMGGHAEYKTAIDNYNRMPLEDKIAAVNTI